MCILKLMGSRPGQGYHKVFIPHLAMILYSPKPRNITFQKKKRVSSVGCDDDGDSRGSCVRVGEMVVDQQVEREVHLSLIHI